MKGVVMATLPWTKTDTHTNHIDADADGDGEVIVLGSRLELRRFRDIPGFLRAAMRIRKQVHTSPGAYGVSLIAQPARKTFWTLSAWADETTLQQFVRTAPHVGVMSRYHDRLDHATFTTWTHPAGALPAARSNAKALWNDARTRLAAAEAEERA
jgi:hypothetical protein